MIVKVVSLLDEQVKELEREIAAYQAGLKTQILRALTVVEAEIVANLRGRSGLHRRTGALLNSVSRSKKVFEEGGILYGTIGPEGVPYARIHEEGGTITAKGGKSLTIPAEQNRRADGLPKITMQDLFAGRAGKNWFINKGNVFLVEGKSKITPLFYLRKSVTIPARPYLSTALTFAAPKIMQEFGLFLSATFASK